MDFETRADLHSLGLLVGAHGSSNICGALAVFRALLARPHSHYDPGG